MRRKTFLPPSLNLSDVLGVNDRKLNTEMHKYIPQKSGIEFTYNKAWVELIDKIDFEIYCKEGWDGDAAPPLSKQLLKRSTEYMWRYIFASYRKTGKFISLPSISPVGDGSIDFEWHTETGRLLINYKYNRDDHHNKVFTTSLYGDNNHNKFRIKETITGKHLSNALINWLPNLR